MDIRYYTEPEDLVAGMERHWSTSRSLRRTRVRANVAWAVAAGVLIVMRGFLSAPEDVVIYATLGLLCGMILYPMLSMLDRLLHRRSAKRHIAGGRHATLLGEHTLSVSNEGVQCRNDHGESRASWSAVEAFVEDQNYALVYLGAAVAIIIPRSKILAGDYHAVADAIRERVPSSTESRPAELK